MSFTSAAARDLAIEALAHIAADPDLLQALVQDAGLSPQDLRGLPDNPDIALALLDFVLEDDARVIGFARAARMRPEAVMQARTALAGPGSLHWAPD